MTNEMLRAPAEAKYADELEWLESVDEGPKPFSWRLSPRMVRLFVLGSERSDGLDREISQKWFGDRSLVDGSIVTLSSALKRRFNFVRIPVVTNKRSEAEIVRFRTTELLRRHRIELDVPPTLLDILLQSFADLRAAAAMATSDDEKLESALSTAEQIGVLEDAILHSQFFGDRTLRAETLGGSLVGTLARRSPEDLAILNKYLHGVVVPRCNKDGGGWKQVIVCGR